MFNKQSFKEAFQLVRFSFILGESITKYFVEEIEEMPTSIKDFPGYNSNSKN